MKQREDQKDKSQVKSSCKNGAQDIKNMPKTSSFSGNTPVL